MQARVCRSVMSGAVAALAAALLAAPAAAQTTTLVIDSGPLIRTELFRSDGASALNWEELAFNFNLPVGATGDGVLRVFAGGDLNNIGVDWIDATAGPFGDRTLLGTYAFPVGDVHFTACEQPPHGNPAGCPVPENVPGGLYYDPTRGPAVGDVEGRRDTTMFSAGTRGLVVPLSLLDGGPLLISLFPRSAIFDLYIDRIELTYASPIPEPSTAWLLLAGLAVAARVARGAARRRLDGAA
jgi:hypothetical protein